MTAPSKVPSASPVVVAVFTCGTPAAIAAREAALKLLHAQHRLVTAA